MQNASLVIAICGLVLACLSLGWQAANYVLTGGRIKVQLRVGAMNHRGMMTAPPGSLKQDWLATFVSEGYPRPIVAVQVANVGRQPVTVERWGLKSTVGTLYPVADSIGKPLPHRLEVGQSETWAVDLEPVADLATLAGKVAAKRPAPSGLFSHLVAATAPGGIVGVAELADGRSKQSRDTFR